MPETSILDASQEVQTGETSKPSLKEMISAARDKEELAGLAEKLGLKIDSRMTIENIKKRLISVYKSRIKEAKDITQESTGKMATKEDPPVRMKFMIMDILNPDESPVFEFNNDCGKGVAAGGIIPKWSFMHGETYEVPYSIYEFLQTCTIPRSKWIEDPSAPSGLRSVVFQQKRFNCELVLSKEEVLKLRKTA